MNSFSVFGRVGFVQGFIKIHTVDCVVLKFSSYLVELEVAFSLHLTNVFRLLDKRKRLLIGMDAAFGMEYLHGKNIVHFDLKSDNLLVNLRDPHRPICKVGTISLVSFYNLVKWSCV